MFKNVLNLVGTGDFSYEIRMYYFIVKVLFFLIIKFVKRRDNVDMFFGEEYDNLIRWYIM